MFSIINLKEFNRMFCRYLKVKFKGIKEYDGDSDSICRQIIDDCFDGDHFNVSNGHFRLFYSRDFSWVVKSLLDLGYKDKVALTLDYALDIFRKQGHVMVAIFPDKKGFDFPLYSVDSLPSIIYSLASLNDKKLISKYKGFI